MVKRGSVLFGKDKESVESLTSVERTARPECCNLQYECTHKRSTLVSMQRRTRLEKTARRARRIHASGNVLRGKTALNGGSELWYGSWCSSILCVGGNRSDDEEAWHGVEESGTGMNILHTGADEND